MDTENTENNLGDEALQLGIVPLRPLTLSDLIGGAVQALRRNAAALIGTGLIVAVVGELFGIGVTVLATGSMAPDPPAAFTSWSDIQPYLTSAGIAAVVMLMANIVLTGVGNVVVSKAVFGHTTGLGAAMRAVAPKLLPLFGVLVLTWLMFVGLGAIGVTAMLASPVGILVMLGALVGIMYLSIALAFSSSVVVVEGLGVLAALQRSRTLVHAVGWWRVFGITLLVGVVGMLMGAIVGSVFGLVSGGSSVGVTLGTIVVSTVYGPASVVLNSLLYVDHRCRSEGVEGLWREAG
jgi:hypothetical protein